MTTITMMMYALPTMTMLPIEKKMKMTRTKKELFVEWDCCLASGNAS